MRPITTLAVTAGATVPCPDVLTHDKWAVLFNESGLNMQVSTALGTRTLPAWTGDKFKLRGPGQTPSLSVTGAALLNQGNAPASSVTGDLYGETEEEPQGQFPIALSRQVSVGNQVSTTGTNSVINDGQVAPTEVVEATPQGASASELKWNNDGSGIFGGGNDVVDATGKFTAMPADAIPPAALAAGALDTDVVVPQADLDSGTMIHPVHPPFSAPGSNAFTTGIDFGGHGSGIGTFGSANQDLQSLSSGANLVEGASVVLKETGAGGIHMQNAAGADIASVSDAGVLGAVQVPGSLVTGTVPNSTDLAGALTAFTFAGAGYNNIMLDDAPVSAAGTPTGLAFRSWDGTTQHHAFGVGSAIGTYGGVPTYVDDNGVVHAGAGALPAAAVSGDLPAAVTHGGANIAALKSAGGGAAGGVIWEGTTDPGVSAAEGDIWLGA